MSHTSGMNIESSVALTPALFLISHWTEKQTSHDYDTEVNTIS